MKSILKTVGALFFATYVLVISSGFTVSHIYCSDGEQWVMGNEMPPFKHSPELETSSCKLEQQCNTHPQNKDNRKKDTYGFKLDIEGKEGSTQNIVLISFDSQSSRTPLTNGVDLFSYITIEKTFFGFHPPPDLLKLGLTELQVFRI